MSELMEYRLHLVYGQILLQVAHVDDDRTYHLALGIHILLAHIVHPRTTTLAVTGQPVSGEDAQQLSVVVGHLEGLHQLGVV